MTCTSYNCNQPKTTRDHLEPVDGTSGDETWKPERSVPELFSDGREAQDDMEVVLDAVDEELHHVFRRWRRLRRFSLDNGEQLGDDFALLVTGEQVRHETLAGNLNEIKIGGGGGPVVSVLSFYSEDPSSNPADAYSFFCNICVWK